MANRKQNESKDSATQEEEKRPRRTMLYFTHDELVIPVWGIMTVEKVNEFNERDMSMHYLVVLNKNQEVGAAGNPVGERRLDFFDSELRDKQFKRILQTLQESDVDIITF